MAAEMSRKELHLARPKRRRDCERGGRPCVWISCRYNLAVKVEGPHVFWCHPGKGLEELAETCALDVAAKGPHTLEEVGRILNVTRERARQIEAKALRKLGLVPLLRAHGAH